MSEHAHIPTTGEKISATMKAKHAAQRAYVDECETVIDRLREQVEHLSQYAHCSQDRHDGITHGGASVCQLCVNRLREENERLRAETKEQSE